MRHREVRERLLKAWRGEIKARATYELIASACRRAKPRSWDAWRGRGPPPAAARGPDARARHRVPSPDSVRLSGWARLQVRIAPIDRLLAAREAAEDDEVDDLYKRSTGDATTDRLLHDIRKEERSHSMAVTDMRSRDSSEQPDGPP